MPSPSKDRGFYRLCLLLILLLCLSRLPPHPASTTAAVYRVRIPIVTGPSKAPPPSSDELIDAAVAAGSITAETGLLYKVYSTFGDPRLPAQYKGDDSKVPDSHALELVQQSWSTLSAPTREIMRPFLTPPIFQGSWYSLRLAGSAATTGALRDSEIDAESNASLAAPYPICSDIDRAVWTSEPGTSSHVRVWWPRADLAAADGARAFLAAMDSTIWSKLTGLMGAPLEDGACPCGADDSRLDIYVMAIDRSYEQSLQPLGCKATPGYIVIDPSRPNDTLAHEFMHAIQDRFATANSCVYASDYAWLCEATAVWAQNYVYPTSNKEHYTAEWFQDTPSLKLDTKNDKREYGAYVFPFYIAGTQGAPVIRTMWDNTTTNSGLDAVDKAIQGGFKEVWPRFVAYNWNRAPYDYYRQWDGLTYSAKEETVDVALDGAIIKELDAGPEELPALSAAYYHYKFADPKVRSFSFYNGWNYKVVKRTVGSAQGLDYGQGYYADAADAEKVKGASVTALIKIDGNWRKEDWSQKGVMGFCLDKKDERLQELVLIFGNSAHKPAGNTLAPTGERPKLVFSNIGCYQWEGSVSVVKVSGTSCPTTWNISSSGLLWERMGTMNDPFVGYALKEGSVNWSITGDCGHTHGGGSFSLVPAHGGNILLSGNLVLSGKLFQRMTGGANDLSEITYVCNDNPCTDLLGTWAHLPETQGNLKPDGSLDVTFGEGDETWTWKLTPKAE